MVLVRSAAGLCRPLGDLAVVGWSRAGAAWPRRSALACGAVAALFVIWSADEAALIHESLGALFDPALPGGDRSRSAVPVTGLWPIAIGIP